MQNNSLHILIVASWYPSDDKPTVGSFIKEQAEMLSQYGHTVTVLHPYLLGTFKESIFKKEVISCTNEPSGMVIRIGIKPLLPGARKLAYTHLYKKVKSYLRALGKEANYFDIVHSHSMFMGGYIGQSLAEEWSIPHIHTEHTSGLIFQSEQYNSTDQQIIKHVFNDADRTLFVSQFAMDETARVWEQKKNEKFTVIHNIVDHIFFEQEFKKTDAESFRYILIANLSKVKGLYTLIGAWKIVLNMFPNSMLSIAGDGPLKKELQNFVDEQNLTKSITFLPKLSRVDVANEISKQHVLVSSSIIETFGLTVAEAQAMGKPVVVTDSGGVRDIVIERTGIITGQSIEEFAGGLINIQINFDNYSPEFMRENAKKHFSAQVIYKRLCDIYQSI